MASLRKPKKLKYPKKPKRSASAASLDRYLKKIKDVDRENARREKAYKDEKAKRERLQRKVFG